ncbi:MAG: OB-fold nucleic acid binding domain-containing protein, partial [Desulfobacteraceae bacterium]
VQDIPGLKDKAPVKVAGVVENLSIKRTKKGDKMATLDLEDQTGSVSVVVFPDVFTAHASLLAGDTPILVAGAAEVSENSAKMRAQEVVSLETVRQRSIRAICLELHRERASREALESVRDVFYRFPGDCPVQFRVEAEDGRWFLVSANDHFKVFPCDEMIEELELLTGERVSYAYGEEDKNTGKSLNA